MGRGFNGVVEQNAILRRVSPDITGLPDAGSLQVELRKRIKGAIELRPEVRG
jgi:hypothetical protein